YTVYDSDVDNNIQTTDVKLDQSQGKPDIPKFDIDPNDVDLSDADEISAWNTAWKSYWKKHWNGGKYYGADGEGPLQVRPASDFGWPSGDKTLISKHPNFWNGKDWVPLGIPDGVEPGKRFNFKNRERLKHHIPNSHYYAKDSDGKVWLVELIQDSSPEGGYIDYYLFEDGSPSGMTGYVDLDEITKSTNVSDDTAADYIPEEIRTYIDGTKTSPLPEPLTYKLARQNFANWYQYYRRRELTAKAALGRVIYGAN
ncbi:MAG: hypothetical protein GY869_12485, partial [Planctomycetes bacterium]|nr:hypothetical protein [Planctomycetota bacterium]